MPHAVPNFLIIGAAKAGTTALWRFLSQHPEIYMSPHKEPRYFALCDRAVDFEGPGDKTLFRFVTEYREYQDLFAGVTDQKAIGEASPWYLYEPTAAAAIKRRLPDVKLVAVLRDPVDRAFSNYLHAVNENLDPAPTFRAAMEDEPRRIQQKWSPRFHYVQKGFYYRQLQHYLQYFDRERVRVYLYEDLTDQPHEMFKDLFQYLEVSASFTINAAERHNDSRALRSKYIARALKSVPSGVRMAFPEPARVWLKKVIEDFNRKPKPVLSPEDRASYVEIYRDDILKLQDLLDRDLSAWMSA